MKKLFRIGAILSIAAILLIPALPVSAIKNGTFDGDPAFYAIRQICFLLAPRRDGATARPLGRMSRCDRGEWQVLSDHGLS